MIRSSLLLECVADVVNCGRGNPDAGSLADYLRSEDGWFVWEMPQQLSSGRGYFSVLLHNAARAGCARHCLTVDGDLRLRADIPRPAGDDLGDDGAEAGPLDLIRDSLVSDAKASATLDALRLCRQTGWPCTERSNGRVAVELESRAGSVVAIVEPTPNGLDVSVDLLSIEAETTTVNVVPGGNLVATARWPSAGQDRSQPEIPRSQCLDAIGLFLLRLAGSVRMVRPIAREVDGQILIQLHVHVPASDPELHLPHAFAALSVAAGLGRAECHALLEPPVARMYLTMT